MSCQQIFIRVDYNPETMQMTFFLRCANMTEGSSQGGTQVPKFLGDIGNASLIKFIVTWQ